MDHHLFSAPSGKHTEGVAVGMRREVVSRDDECSANHLGRPPTSNDGAESGEDGLEDKVG